MGDAVNVVSRLEGFREVDRIKFLNRTRGAYRVRVTAFDGE